MHHQLSTIRAALASLSQLENNPVAIYLLSLAQNSRATQHWGLGRIARVAFGWAGGPESFPWHELRAMHVTWLRSWLEEHYAPSTANRLLGCVKSVLFNCYCLELMPERDYRLATHVRGIRGRRLPPGRALEADEVTRLLHACDLRLPLQARGAAIVALLFGGGLRRSEAMALNFEDIDFRESRLRIRKAKGNKDRQAYVPRTALDWLRAWLTYRGCGPGPLFWSTMSAGPGIRRLVPGSRLSCEGASHVLEAIAERAGVEFTSHDGRRTFISDMFDAGWDVAIISRQVGHAHAQTTTQYDRRPDRAVGEAVRGLALPGPARGRRRTPPAARSWAA